jgi:hypothetical protein
MAALEKKRIVALSDFDTLCSVTMRLSALSQTPLERVNSAEETDVSLDPLRVTIGVVSRVAHLYLCVLLAPTVVL